MENVFANAPAMPVTSGSMGLGQDAASTPREPTHAERLMELYKRVGELEENMRQAAAILQELQRKLG